LARKVVSGGTVLTMNAADEIFSPGYVAWEDDKLTAVGPGSPPAALLEGAEHVDATGCVVLPGFVNAHTHVSMTLLRGFADDMPVQEWLERRIWPVEAKLSSESVYWGALLGIAEMIRGGTTTFNDMYHHFEACAQAIVDSGIRGCPSGVLLGFLPWRKQLANAKSFVRDWKGAAGGRVIPFLGPHALYTCPDKLLRRVAEVAGVLEVPLHIHVAETEAHRKRAFAEYGESPVQHLASLGVLKVPTLAAHCVWVDEADMATLAETGTGVALNLGSNLKLASGVPPIAELVSGGVKVGLGTDGPASNNNLSMLEEIRLTALLPKGLQRNPELLQAYQVLKLATFGSAQALHQEASIGSLEVGKQADLQLVSLEAPHLSPVHNVISHLVYSAFDYDVRDVFVAGEPLLRQGEFQRLDLAEIKAKVQEQLHRLLD